MYFKCLKLCVVLLLLLAGFSDRRTSQQSGNEIPGVNEISKELPNKINKQADPPVPRSTSRQDLGSENESRQSGGSSPNSEDKSTSIIASSSSRVFISTEPLLKLTISGPADLAESFAFLKRTESDKTPHAYIGCPISLQKNSAAELKESYLEYLAHTDVKAFYTASRSVQGSMGPKCIFNDMWSVAAPESSKLFVNVTLNPKMSLYNPSYHAMLFPVTPADSTDAAKKVAYVRVLYLDSETQAVNGLLDVGIITKSPTLDIIFKAFRLLVSFLHLDVKHEYAIYGETQLKWVEAQLKDTTYNVPLTIVFSGRSVADDSSLEATAVNSHPVDVKKLWTIIDASPTRTFHVAPAFHYSRLLGHSSCAYEVLVGSPNAEPHKSLLSLLEKIVDGLTTFFQTEAQVDSAEVPLREEAAVRSPAHLVMQFSARPPVTASKEASFNFTADLISSLGESPVISVKKTFSTEKQTTASTCATVMPTLVELGWLDLPMALLKMFMIGLAYLVIIVLPIAFIIGILALLFRCLAGR